MTRLALPLLLLAAACSGDGGDDKIDTGVSDTDTDTDADADTGDSGITMMSPVGFAADIEPMTSVECATCHTSGASGGFSNANTLAGWLSTSSAGIAYCTPGDLSQSYGYLKLIGDQASVGGGGAQMPTNGTLAPGQLAVFEQWVQDGCQP